MADWVYKDSRIYMKRKYSLYKELVDRANNTQKAKYKYVYRNSRNNMWIADVYLGNKKTLRLGENFPSEEFAYNFQQNWIKSNFIDK